MVNFKWNYENSLKRMLYKFVDDMKEYGMKITVKKMKVMRVTE